MRKGHCGVVDWLSSIFLLFTYIMPPRVYSLCVIKDLILLSSKPNKLLYFSMSQPVVGRVLKVKTVKNDARVITQSAHLAHLLSFLCMHPDGLVFSCRYKDRRGSLHMVQEF